MNERDLAILKEFRVERKPSEVYESKNWEFSRATFYRRLEKLKRKGLIEWKTGRAKITERGLQLLKLFDSEEVLELERDEERGEVVAGSFCITDSASLKQLSYKYSFLYIAYPATSYILKTILLYAGIKTKGLSTNAEKFKAIVNSEVKVNLAIDNFENATKQSIVFLRELIYAGKIEKLYVGVKDERKALRNSKLLEFFQEFGFENAKGLKLDSDEITMFPLLLVILITFGITVAYRLGVEYAPIYAFFILIYFLRSSLFREIRK